jgi:parallel beta-helix repeat protein
MSAAVILSTAAEIGNVNIGSNAADVRLDMTGTNSRAHSIGASAGETWAILVSGNECVLDDVNTGSGLGDSCIEVTGQRAQLSNIKSNSSGTASAVRITGADCVLNGLTSNTDDTGLEISGATRWQARNVNVQAADNEGILITSSDHGILEATVYNSGRHGISITDSSHNRLSGQVIDAGKDTNNTYDGVILAGNSDRNRTAFTVTYLGSGNQARYGLNISASTCDSNIEASLLLAGSTGHYNDAGTGTVATDDHIV